MGSGQQGSPQWLSHFGCSFVAPGHSPGGHWTDKFFPLFLPYVTTQNYLYHMPLRQRWLQKSGECHQAPWEGTQTVRVTTYSAH